MDRVVYCHSGNNTEVTQPGVALRADTYQT